MRITLTVVTAHERRDVLVEGDETATVAGLTTALATTLDASSGRGSNVVRLPHARAPYDLGGRRALGAESRRSPRHQPGTSHEVDGRAEVRGRSGVEHSGVERSGVGERSAVGERGDGRAHRSTLEPRAELWLDGRPLDPGATVFGLLRDGDVVALDRRAARATVTEEPGGLVELRVVGGPGSGSVHRLGIGAHTIGADPTCAVAVPDSGMPPVAVVIRLTPSGVTVEPADLGETAPEQAGQQSGRRAAKRLRQATKKARKAKRRGRRQDGAAQVGAAQVGAEEGVARLEGEPVTEAVPWPEWGMLACGNSVFSLGPVEPPDTHLDALPDGGLAYNRPPRLQPSARNRRIVVPAEPRRAEGMRLQLLAALLPAVLGVVMAVAFQVWFYLLIAFMTPLIMIGQWVSDRRHGKKKHRRAVKAYRERLTAFENEVARAVREDEAARRDGAPDPAEVLLTATGPRRRLWERRIHDRDALRLRVGLADLPAALEFELESGTPQDAPRPEPPTCHDVPVALVMRRLGVAGLTGPRKTALGCARWLLGQAAALHSPRDLAIVVLSANPDSERQWGWVRWLPHCTGGHYTGSARGGPLGTDCVTLVGTDPEAAARRVAELTALIDERLDEEGKAGQYGTALGGSAPGGSALGGGRLTGGARLTGGPAGWDDLGRGGGAADSAEPAFAGYDEQPFDVLVILDGAQVLRGLPGMPQVLRQGPHAGVYTIAIDGDQRLLPEECATVVSCSSDGKVRLHGGGLEAIGAIRADQVSVPWADRVGRALAPLRDVSREDSASAVPGSARLLDLLDPGACDPDSIAKRWGRTTRAVIGVGPDGPFEVDLSRDGPHALIAGTTGAGKSELLQTLISSLAVANRPDEMTFVLIDYKGGAAFKECVRLPHTVGMVSDLDGHLTQRALSSLAAEIRRRERLLLDAGAKDIEEYQRLRSRGATWVLGSEGVRQVPAAGLFGTSGGIQHGGLQHAGLQHEGGQYEGERPPLPRLVLIIDEFAALVTELPDFVEGLVDIARRGRSLGIHLILATQRPAGVVTADIQANTSLRIALRVTDARESADVIDAPDAAHISRATPGRCYVRAGSGPAVAVQTARIGGRSPRRAPAHASGAPAADGGGGAGGAGTGAGGAGRAAHGGEPLRVIELAWPELGHSLSVPTVESGDDSDLALLVDAILEAGRNAPKQPSPWLPPLPELVTLSVTGRMTEDAGACGDAGTIGDAKTVRGIGAMAGPGTPLRNGTAGGAGTPFGTLGAAAEETADGQVASVHSVATAGPYRRGGQEVPPLPFGLVDLPSQQDRRPLVLDPRNGGHLLIAGAARSGRSTALRTIAGSIAAGTSPEDVHIHAIDCGSGALLPLVGLPHCGAVVTRDQLDRVERLLTRLRAEVGRRQQLLAESGYASLTEARTAARGRGAAGPGGEVGRLPWLVLLLDRWEGYVAAFENYDYGRLLDALMQLLREGPAVGLRAVVTSDRSGLIGQISTIFDDRLILRLADPTDYGLAGLPVRDLPSSMPPGRALSVGEQGLVESQIALLSPDPSGPAQVAVLQELGRTAAARFGNGGERRGRWVWASEPPLRVDALPMRITAEQALSLVPSFVPPSPLWALLGAGGDALAPLGVDLLGHGPAAVIAGPPRSGRSSCLVTAARSLLGHGTPVVVVTPRRSALRELTGTAGVIAVLDGNARSIAGGGLGISGSGSGPADGGGASGGSAPGGGVPDGGEGVQDLLALVKGQERYVVLVDDAELISPDSPLGLALEEILRTGRDSEHGLLIAGPTGDLATAYRGFVAEARKSRTGLLLSVQSPADGDIFNVRLPRGAVGGPTGRGLLVISGTATPIQAAIPAQ